MSTSAVFDRTGADEISRRTFYATLALALTWSFVATAMMANACKDWHPGVWQILGLGLVVPIIGILITRSESAVISFIGLHFVCLPFGAIIAGGLNTAEHGDPGVVFRSAMATAGITVFMGIVGISFPKVFENMGGALLTAVLGLILLRVVSMFIPAFNAFGWIEYLTVGIFSLYVAFDMARASTIPATMNNAVDVAVSLYLDVLNIFLAIMNINTNKND